MPDKQMCDYALRRLEKSSEDLETAQICYDAGKFDGAANRAYYSVYQPFLNTAKDYITIRKDAL